LWSVRYARILDGVDLSQLTLDRTSTAALYVQLVAALTTQISQGTIAPGSRLPAERVLARQLRVSRTTVVSAYQELHTRGLVRAQVGRGTFVSARPVLDEAAFAWNGKLGTGALRTQDAALRTLVQLAASATQISFAVAVPDPKVLPTTVLHEQTVQLLERDPLAALRLSPTDGWPPLRQALAARLQVAPQQVLIVAGVQQGLDLIARCLLDAGDAVVVEQPCYVGALETFRAAGVRMLGWDRARADLAELEDLVLRYRPRLLYTNPTYQNPTGQVMELTTRCELLDLAARYGVPIIEDDPYAEMYFDRPPPPALARLDQQQVVIYLGSSTKALGPGLRVGWLVAATSIVEQLTLIKQRSDLSTASFGQRLVAQVLVSGTFDAHLRALRTALRQRYETLQTLIEQYVPQPMLTAPPVQGGMYVWCRIDPRIDVTRLSAAAATAGVTFTNGGWFYVDHRDRQRLRLCFSALSPDQIEVGVHRLARAIQHVQRSS